jgi:hypothetical protein
VYVGLMPVYSGTICLFIQAAGELKHQTFTCLPGVRGGEEECGVVRQINNVRFFLPLNL